MLFYFNVGCTSPESLIFSDKNLNSAFVFAKRLCKESNKIFLGVVDHRIISKYTSL